jgi:acyl-coenzyme A synthetase/AMP-(fatty) acid ligase
MKLFKQGVNISSSVFDKVDYYRQALRSQQTVIINSPDHTEHIAAFWAWQDTPGKILIVNPLLSTKGQQYIINSADNYQEVNDAVFFHTSGTTGRPKIVQHGRSQFSVFAAMSTKMFQPDSATKFLSVMPPFASGFWQAFLPIFYQNGFELHLSSLDKLVQDLTSTDFDVTFWVPNLVDYLQNSHHPVSFDSFRCIYLGGSVAKNQNFEFLFNNGASTCGVGYGTTETGSPLLCRSFTKDNQFYEYTNLIPLADGVKFQIQNQELWVQSPSLCDNFKIYDHVDDWRCTGDLWDQQGDLIKFIGRKDDIVKVNGFHANLLAIEAWWEDHGSVGECIARVKSIGGSDYIELVHTRGLTQADQANLKSQAQEIFSKFSIPAKFTLVDAIPKTAMGKKQRH